MPIMLALFGITFLFFTWIKLLRKFEFCSNINNYYKFAVFLRLFMKRFLVTRTIELWTSFRQEQGMYLKPTEP